MIVGVGFYLRVVVGDISCTILPLLTLLTTIVGFLVISGCGKAAVCSRRRFSSGGRIRARRRCFFSCCSSRTPIIITVYIIINDVVSDIAVFVLKRDVKLQPTNHHQQWFIFELMDDDKFNQA